MTHYFKTQANARAQQEITAMVQGAARMGKPIHSGEVARRLNLNRSRGFSIARVGCLLRSRTDVEFIDTGIWKPVIAAAAEPQRGGIRA